MIENEPPMKKDALNAAIQRIIFRNIVFVLLLVFTQTCKMPDDASCRDSDSVAHGIINLKDSLKVLILGNSITQQGPQPELGWNNNWGMAASALDKNFVHVLYRHITDKVKNKTELRFENIAWFEKDFEKFDSIAFEQNFSKHYQYNPDLIIIRIGDNVEDSSFDEKTYQKKYEELIRYFWRKHDPYIIGTSCFFTKRRVDDRMRAACKETATKYVDLSCLIRDESNIARSERAFVDAGVGYHSGDKGMRSIADLLWNDVSKFLQ